LFAEFPEFINEMNDAKKRMSRHVMRLRYRDELLEKSQHHLPRRECDGVVEEEASERCQSPVFQIFFLARALSIDEKTGHRGSVTGVPTETVQKPFRRERKRAFRRLGTSREKRKRHTRQRRSRRLQETSAQTLPKRRC
jgi:hypothetical protein